jgi:hypothetical protein
MLMPHDDKITLYSQVRMLFKRTLVLLQIWIIGETSFEPKPDRNSFKMTKL